jgi:hypothetical protein
MTVKDFLLLLMSAGSGGVVYWAMESFAWLKNLKPEAKRYVSYGLAALLPVVGWLLGIGMDYWESPIGWRAWVEAVFALAAGAIIVSGGLHGRLQLSKRA